MNLDDTAPNRNQAFLSQGFKTPVYMDRRQSGCIAQLLLDHRQIKFQKRISTSATVSDRQLAQNVSEP